MFTGQAQGRCHSTEAGKSGGYPSGPGVNGDQRSGFLSFSIALKDTASG